MNVGPWQLIIIALVILVLFGRGRISEMMGDFGKGIKSFKQGMTDEDKASAAPPPAQIPPASTPTATDPVPAPAPAEKTGASNGA